MTGDHEADFTAYDRMFTPAPATPTTMEELHALALSTWPDVDLYRPYTTVIPWGEVRHPDGYTVSGLMVDQDGDVFRVGVYADLAEEDLYLREVPTAGAAWDILQVLTGPQSQREDWSAWAARWCRGSA